MNILGTKLWRSDLDEVIDGNSELSTLAGKGILITGCTGLICSAITDIFIRWNEKNDEKIIIIAAGRNPDAIRRRFEPWEKEEWFKIVKYDSLWMEKSIDEDCEYIIHGASNASPNKFMSEPVETLLSNIIGTKVLLDLAIKRKSKRLLFISSSEVYGQSDGKRSEPRAYGGIDILNPRSSYSIGKCAAENLCISYLNEYGVDSVIVRPGHIYGPTARETDARVSSMWPYVVMRGEDIVMKSDGSQIRSYCYAADCAAAVIKVLLKGSSGHSYDISNPDSVISIKEVAQILAKIGGVRVVSELPTDQERKGFNPAKDSSLDGLELLGLGWTGKFDAERGFEHTVSILKEMNEHE